ncbi:MAG: YceI family protein [Povalibacter sp.]
MNYLSFSRALMAVTTTFIAGAAMSAPATYQVDPKHTYPSFEADHLGGVSVWRGKLNSSSGTIVFDKEAGTGTVDIQIDMASIDFGNDKLNEHASSPQMFDIQKFPTATYSGKFSGAKDGKPTQIDGTLTMHGVTKPVKLTVNSFKCVSDMQTKKERCGADASGTINREEFGVSYGKDYGFNQTVKLLIQVEALRQ